jgi:hypothetical protein
MLVVKILSANSKTFNGVNYNENKIGQEKSDLMIAANFYGLDHKAEKQDYIRYLKNQSEGNERIKKPQFHATISAKGKETSFEDLKKFGEHYMRQMGYGENPYLIYKHTDTDNNHIHIVSTRIDNEGNKIKDSFERVRSQKILSEYFGLDILKEIQNKIDAIDKYHIGNISQYKLLLEYKFKKVIEKNDVISVYQGQHKVDISKYYINKIIYSNKGYTKTPVIAKRKEELRDYLLDLSNKHTLNEIKVIADKNKISIEVFKTKDGSQNFGYSVIDHKSKSVFKGSGILPLKALENNKILNDQKKSVTRLINDIKTPKSTLEDINDSLKIANIKIDSNGFVYDLNSESEKEILRINRSTVYELNYNSKIKHINENFKALNNEDLRILAFAYKVKMSDLNLSGNSSDKLHRADLSYKFNTALRFYLNNEKNAKEQLGESSLSLFRLGSQFYAIDKDKNFIGSIELDNDVKKGVEDQELFTELSSNKEYQKSPSTDYSLQAISNDLENLFEYYDEGGKNRMKKRRSEIGKTR